MTSLSAGLGAILMHQVLGFVERLAFGVRQESRLNVFEEVAPAWRVLVLVLVASFSAVVWCFLQSKNRKLISIKKQVEASTALDRRPPFLPHIGHAFLQIFFVGAGGPVGKESAPREFGALTAGRSADFAEISEEDRRLLIISGASAGLAAVYQVPVASVFFAFETLNLKVTVKNALVVLFTTFLAAQCAQVTISTTPLYQLASGQFNWKLSLCYLVMTVFLTLLARLFRSLTKLATSHRIQSTNMLWSLPLISLLVGLTAGFFPQILGNGAVLAQSVFSGISLQLAVTLLILKALATLLTLYAGAYGGTLTPSFSLGATAGLLLGSLSLVLIPQLSLETCMLMGAAVFLTITMRAPFTALFLVLSFTGQHMSLIIPILLVVFIARYTDIFFRKRGT